MKKIKIDFLVNYVYIKPKKLSNSQTLKDYFKTIQRQQILVYHIMMNIHKRQGATRGRTCRVGNNCNKPNCHWHHTQGWLRDGINCRTGNNCNRTDCHFNHQRDIAQYQQQLAQQTAVQQQQQMAYEQQQLMAYQQQLMMQMVQQQMIQQPIVQQPIVQQPIVQQPVELSKQELGNKLHPLIQAVEPRLAGKITGMLLEMDNTKLLVLLDDQKALMNKINEALCVLKDHQMKQSKKQSKKQ